MDNDRNEFDRTDDRLWKIRDLFEIIRTNFSTFYNPSEHLAVDEVIVKFKGRVLFKQFIPKKPVGPDHCQQPHPYFFMWWEENLTQRFSTHPYQRDAGASWS
jgi:hypothetical protein